MKLITRFSPRLAQNLKSSLYTSCILSSDSKYRNDQLQEEKKNKRVLPPEPTHCCKSGCADCVWIKYAQELAQLYEDGDVLAKKKIKENVKDQKLRAFLFTQLGLKE